MNTFKKSSIIALSLSLLLSAPAQAIGFAQLYQQAGQYAQNLWANRPAMPKVSLPSMPNISMPSISREQVEAGIEAFGNYAQKAEKLMAQYPKTTMAAKYSPLVAAMAYVGIKSYGQSAYAQSPAKVEIKKHKGNGGIHIIEVTMPLDDLKFYR